MHVLVVEDEVRMAMIIARGLKAEGYAVTTAHSARAGPGAGRHGPLRPHRSRPVAARFLGHRSAAPTAPAAPQCTGAGRDGSERARSEGREFSRRVRTITSPSRFAFAELVMRVKALLRRAPLPVSDMLRIADLELDRLGRRVYRAGRRVELSPKEFGLLEYLLLKPQPGALAQHDHGPRVGSVPSKG